MQTLRSNQPAAFILVLAMGSLIGCSEDGGGGVPISWSLNYGGTGPKRHPNSTLEAAITSPAIIPQIRRTRRSTQSSLKRETRWGKCHLKTDGMSVRRASRPRPKPSR